MIDVEDLRVGNFVYQDIYDFDAETYQTIVTIGHDSVSTKEFQEVLPFNKLSGIPLSEEWLVKLGFANEDYKDGYYGKTVKSQSLTYDFVVKIEDWGIFYELKGNLIVTIDSVHQLQNLYFALTNKELTVKENQ